jgi:hypothetical protein
MKYPQLVREKDCKTPCTVVLFAEGITEDGAPQTAFSGECKCIWQSSARRIRTAKHEEVTLTAEAWFCGDLCPALPEITDGKMTVDGVCRRIVTGTKARNPDGTVNYTLLGVV